MKKNADFRALTHKNFDLRPKSMQKLRARQFLARPLFDYFFFFSAQCTAFKKLYSLPYFKCCATKSEGYSTL